MDFVFFGVKNGVVNGVVNLGMWFIVGGEKVCLEVYLFNFKGDFYGCYLWVMFCYKIWEEIKFDGLEVLKVVI